ncbi:MAG: sigma-54-dependent Fis family transcriptional regulator [Deltaproteobacteria bacterium]|nr:MAG: sigma-54-dependent Fis family transcriptional regulator [Deltaproteobacteria bacterium]
MLTHELNTYWKTVVDTIQDGIMIVDLEGTIVSINKAFEKITGYTQSEIIGKSCIKLNCTTCTVARNRTDDHWCSLFWTQTFRTGQCAIQRADNQFVPVLKNASLLKDAQGQIIGAVETLTDITELIEKDTKIEAFRRELREENRFCGIIGASQLMQQVFDLIINAAHSDAPVIILGESGTGKELIARAIHENSDRKDKPYIKVNCAALNENLLESELFGHVKGAFTGAFQSREGRFEAARGGDIFLDEIGDLPLSIQVKLLRVLEEKVVERVGTNRIIPIDVRIITATNRDLKSLVEKGQFREDLYYRINVIPIHVPPLRDRQGDISLLAESFFRRIQLKSNKRIRRISKEAMESLMKYGWPGNVRELRSAFEYAFVTCQGETIDRKDFPPGILKENTENQQIINMTPLNRDDIKKTQLLEALKQTGGNQSQAARILGISRVTVWNRLKRYGIKAKYVG